MAKVVSKYNGIYTSHIRDEANNLLEAINEVIEIARESNVKTNISHMKALYKQNWEKKKALYAKHGILQGENLIVTYDDERGGIDSHAIRKIIEARLM